MICRCTRLTIRKGSWPRHPAISLSSGVKLAEARGEIQQIDPWGFPSVVFIRIPNTRGQKDPLWKREAITNTLAAARPWQQPRRDLGNCAPWQVARGTTTWPGSCQMAKLRRTSGTSGLSRGLEVGILKPFPRIMNTPSP